MATNSISNMLNSRMRLSGMASGLDTETMVKQLMAAERMKVDKVKQDKQLLEWRKDNYREITNLLRGFKDEFFDVLKPTSNMRSPNTYNIYTQTSSNPAIATAVAGAGMTSTSHAVEVITVAKASQGASSTVVSKPITGGILSEFNIDGYNNTFILNYNGLSKEIKLPNGSYTDAASIIGNGIDDGKLRDIVKKAFNGNVDVVDNGGKLQFTSINSSDIFTVSSKYNTGDQLLSVLRVNSSGVGSALDFKAPLEIKKGMKFEVSIVESGVTSSQTIQWDADKSYTDGDALMLDLQSKLNAALGDGKVSVSITDNKLSFTKGAGVDSITLSNSDLVKSLGFKSGESNKINLYDTMEEVSTKLAAGAFSFNLGTNDKLKLTINGTEIEINKLDSLSTMISKVNNSNAGVTISYSSYSDVFTLKAKETGAGKISIDDHGSGFFSKIKITDAEIKAGEDASFKIDNIAGTRRNNSFNIDGVTYNLLSQGTTTISFTQNSDEIFNKIKAFVDKYNELIAKINGELGEKYERAYKPLTDEQKEAMSDDEIKKWEEKAKTGLMKNDSILQNIVYSMRSSLYENIKDVSGGLSSIGITTGTYLEKGKLIIDENKLKEAIKNNSDKVMNIFAKQSSISYGEALNDSDKRKTRNSDNGIVYRLYDILEDNIRTSRDSNGKKGTLLEKAGTINDSSDFDNILQDEIDDQEDRIKEMTRKLYDKEDRYYAKFAAMERAMQQMNSQSSWLTQQLGGGQK